MAVLEALTEEECYLATILQDASGLDLAEFAFYDPERNDGCWRAWPFQWSWFRCVDPLQIDQCVAEGQRVLTSTGWVPIERVAVGDLVATHAGRWRPVTHKWDRGVRPVVKVAGQGHPGVVVTADHPLWARHATRASQPRDGHKGKKLAQPSWVTTSQWRWNDNSQVMTTNWASPAQLDALPLPEPMRPAYRAGPQNLVADHMDPNWLWLYGLYLAEGSTFIGRNGDRTHRVVWSVHVDEVAKVSSMLDAVGLNHTVAERDRVAMVSVTSRPVVEWLLTNGGKLAHGKHLAPWIYGLDRTRRLAVFDGMTFGDGWVTDERISYTTVSHELALDTRILAQSLGFSASLRCLAGGVATICGRTVNTRDKWAIDLRPINRQRRPHVQILDGHAWAPVTAIEPAGRAHVYDLEVADDHSFVVEGVVVSNCARAVGKSQSIKLRAFVFCFLHPNGEMVITAPEKVHLDAITDVIETQLVSTRLTREMLTGGRASIKHQPFHVNFVNGARIMGRIPQRDGKGVKGIHPIWLEMDEAQDYPKPGWDELIETLKRGFDGAVWRAHGVTRGVRDEFYKHSQPESDFKVHRYVAMNRPNWTDQERQEKIKLYGGSKDHPTYRRNVLGLHGDLTNPLFVLHRLMKCVDDDETSDYNHLEYQYIRLNDEMVADYGDITGMLDFNAAHKDDKYLYHWIGMDVGFTVDPSEILVFGEYKPRRKPDDDFEPKSKLKLLTRVHLERIRHEQQVRTILWMIDYYHPRVFAMDKTGLGLPLFQDIQDKAPAAADCIKGYNFSEKILVDIDATIEVDEYGGDPFKDAGIKRNVREYAQDCLRDLVDVQRLELPWDLELIAQFQGGTQTTRPIQDQYGRRRIFSAGDDHVLDGARMAALGFRQYHIEELQKSHAQEPVLDIFISY